MTPEDIRALLLKVIARVAPDVDLETLDPAADLRRQADLDSVDMLNIVIGVRDALAIEIPEAEYGQLATLDKATAYLAERLGSPDREP